MAYREAIAAAVFVIAAVFAGESSKGATPDPKEAVIPFVNSGSIRDWSADGREAIYIQDVHGQWYHAKRMSSCTDLQFTDRKRKSLNSRNYCATRMQSSVYNTATTQTYKDCHTFSRLYALPLSIVKPLQQQCSSAPPSRPEKASGALLLTREKPSAPSSLVDRAGTVARTGEKPSIFRMCIGNGIMPS